MPITRSRFDVDFYKPTMAQVVWKRWRDVPVTYTFKNRTPGVNLADYIIEEELREELDYIRSLRFSVEQQWYLRNGWHINRIKPQLFSKDFLYSLENVTLPPVEVRKENGIYAIEVSGPWSEAIWWETMVLSVVNELYCRAWLQRECVWPPNAEKEGERRLFEKTAVLKKHPEIKVVEFDTRRRASRSQQRHALDILLHEIPDQVLGTSNIELAREFNIKPSGTNAHEMGMVLYGVCHDLPNPALAAHHKVLNAWWEEYGETLSIALTDTFGTDFFLENFSPEQAQAWRGFRQDSGDPIKIGEKMIAFYKKCGIDPKTKLLLFSDGLTVESMVKIENHFRGRIQVAFGWGTNLTNDIGVPPLSLVMKVTKANGHDTVKLSDNPAKANGQPEEIACVKQMVGYKDRKAQSVTY